MFLPREGMLRSISDNLLLDAICKAFSGTTSIKKGVGDNSRAGWFDNGRYIH